MSQEGKDVLKSDLKFAACMVVVVMIIGFAIEVGRWFAQVLLPWI